MLPDKSKFISLIFASLTFGALLLFNLDRATNATEGVDNSQHGWPLVYLERTPTEFNIVGRNKTSYAWPWPPVPKEDRVFSWMNLITDFIVGISIVIITYVMLRTILSKVLPDKKPRDL